MDLINLTISELQESFRSGRAHPVDAIDELTRQIESTNPTIGAYLSHDTAKARQLAENADLSLPLGGIPIAIKDSISVTGESCSCASKILKGYTAPYDAGVITRLRAAGAIPYGRLNLDEFAMGASTENSALQKTANPWDLERIPGGSSGGSASAVAARSAFAALGSDTGGSIRQPAGLCGVTGLKPSYGRVSRYGLVAFASSLDQIGPIARSVKDCALLLRSMAGLDKKDSTSVDRPVPDYMARIGEGLKGRKVGIPKEYFGEGIEPGVRKAVEDAIRHCESLGAELVEVSLPSTEFAVSCYYIIATAEASSNLARFDGVRYGHRADGAKGLLDHYLQTREEGFGPEVKRRIILGTYVLSSGYYDAYYLRAQKVRTLIRQDFATAFQKADVLVCPTSPETAFRFGEKSSDPLRMYLSDLFTIAANLAGICGISVPCGFDHSTGKALPVGLQFLGKEFEEETLLTCAHAYQSTTEWHLASPPTLQP
jgi:aspartyl-tRNA(Asn)/glutamyl-tRNA(Gln) amidotransferase subunit A